MVVNLEIILPQIIALVRERSEPCMNAWCEDIRSSDELDQVRRYIGGAEPHSSDNHHAPDNRKCLVHSYHLL